MAGFSLPRYLSAFGFAGKLIGRAGFDSQGVVRYDEGFTTTGSLDLRQLDPPLSKMA